MPYFFSNDYLSDIDKTCSLCLSSPIVIPTKIPCGHSYCMRCYFENRDKSCMKKCPLCRKTNTMSNNDSPVFYLPKNLNIDEFYSKFTRGTLIRTINKNDLIGKLVVIAKDIKSEGKPQLFKQSIIGLCTSVTDESYEIYKGYIFNRNDLDIYPTFPMRRNYRFEPFDVFYYVDNIDS